jgi:rhamnose utilization protein RhaD (predicted bifunctional aldolase and dehydrogenase)
MLLEQLVQLSRKYGSNEEFVLSGGGNTSYKDDTFLYVKASGVQLATIDAGGFAKLRLAALNDMWNKQYPSEPEARDAEVLQDMLSARAEGEEKRPSVETLLHALFPQPYVAHMHPPLVNGVTCSQNGEKVVDELFGDKAVWIPTVNPGYVLARTVKEGIEKQLEKKKPFPRLVFMENHGVFVAGDTTEEIDRQYEKIFSALKARLKRPPDFSRDPRENDKSFQNQVDQYTRAIKDGPDSGALASSCIFFTNREIMNFVKDEQSFTPVSSAFSPDHIVYYGHAPLFITSNEKVNEAVKRYVEKNGENPRIIAVQGLGAFAAAETEKKADTAKALFLDAVKIAVYAESFGGHKFMPDDQINFIRFWEYEKYRKSVDSGRN